MNQFETLRQDLHENYGHEYTAAEIDAKLDEVIAKHTKKAELEEFVPLLVEREVREYFGAHRLHIRFAAGTNNALAQAAAELTRKHAGEALWDIPAADTVEQARELADDLEARVLYMLNKLGIDPVTEPVNA